MTIEVRIENKDATRRMEGIEIAFDKYGGRASEGAPLMMEPGEVRSFHIHNLKDLRVREAHADLQVRRAPEGAAAKPVRP